MPLNLTHEARTMRALDWLFSRITREHGFLTAEVTTHNYSGDNRRFTKGPSGLQDRSKAYERSCCMMTIKMGAGEKDPKVSADYGRQRLHTQIVLICEQKLSKDQQTEGLTLSEVMSHLRTDIRDALFTDPGLDTSWAAVVADDTDLAGVEKPSVAYLMLDGWDMPSPESQDGKQIIFLGYSYDDRQTVRTLA